MGSWWEPAPCGSVGQVGHQPMGQVGQVRGDGTGGTGGTGEGDGTGGTGWASTPAHQLKAGLGCQGAAAHALGV